MKNITNLKKEAAEWNLTPRIWNNSRIYLNTRTGRAAGWIDFETGEVGFAQTGYTKACADCAAAYNSEAAKVTPAATSTLKPATFSQQKREYFQKNRVYVTWRDDQYDRNMEN